MKTAILSCDKATVANNNIFSLPCPLPPSLCFNRHQEFSFLTRLPTNRVLRCAAYATRRGVERCSSALDDKPYEILPNGKRAYLDEQDLVAFLDPPKQLIPLDPSSYNPAAYLWKKIADIPEERRHRLLSLLNPRLISTAWELTGTRYDPKLVIKSAPHLLSDGSNSAWPEYWNCRTSGGPLTISWVNSFKKALFYTSDRKLYGRIIGGSLFSRVSKSIWPLYFKVSQLDEVISTEEPCDLAYEFGDGFLDLNHPQGFPKPAKHPWPFNDQVVIYIRHMGPGVMVGQAWQEGKALDQIPKKLTGEIMMVKVYSV